MDMEVLVLDELVGEKSPISSKGVDEILLDLLMLESTMWQRQKSFAVHEGAGVAPIGVCSRIVSHIFRMRMALVLRVLEKRVPLMHIVT